MQTPRRARGFVISAPSSGQGKTVLTLGLLRAFRKRGVAVVSGKSGPDYIDPGFHRAATGQDCVTLDAWAQMPAQLRARAAERAAGQELMVIEGAMGLFDGAPSGGPVGGGATAEVASALSLPVVLTVDASRMAQSVGAILQGLRLWDQRIAIAGVILNRIGSARHERMIREALPADLAVLGVLPRADALTIPSRHLGLVQAEEHGALEQFLEGAADLVARHCDLDRLQALAEPVAAGGAICRHIPIGQRIAVARDRAFSFIYPHLLDDWRHAGAEIDFFSPLADESPEAACDAVYLPGGYPELYAAQLAAAGRFKAGMTRARERGSLIYGECGGYMALGQSIVSADGETHPMLGFLEVETDFETRTRSLGYRRVSGPHFPGGDYMAHEFHYATIRREEGTPLFPQAQSSEAELPPMGLREGRVMGSFAHLIERLPA